jgi:FkbH-like protein
MAAADVTASSDILREMRHPITPANILRKRHVLKKELLKQSNLFPLRIAILGGSTTTEVKSTLELFLLAQGIQPSFYESGYNRYSEDVLFENPDLWKFEPNVVFIHTNWRNVSALPELTETEEQVEQRIQQEVSRFDALWNKIHSDLNALVIQNNFDLPHLRPLGNLEASEISGRIHFLSRLNAEFAKHARQQAWLLINDIHYLCAEVGLHAWHADTYWYNFHMAVSPAGTVALAQNVAGIIKAAYGRSKKCLVLDLDNTLWGGVVGDDGVQNLVLGRDHPSGEAFLDFQRYVKNLRQRGVILAVCSKNDIENAKAGFSHPDSILTLDDFSAFKANWNPKPENIREIAAELKIGLDSLVFVDDNPVERALVTEQLPEVATPEIGSHVARYAQVIEAERYFEAPRIVADDLNRSTYYSSNAQRSASQAAYRDYGEFLASLEMTAEIAPFSAVYLERITQLINKTNQFNLTTRRYTGTEVEAIAHDPGYISLYGRLIDKFGDNGLVSVLVGRIHNDKVEIDLWLMSCRVLNREMELAMFDYLVKECRDRGIREIAGLYIPSKKNGMVAEHYRTLGFAPGERDEDGRQYFHYDLCSEEAARSRHIARKKPATQKLEQNSPSAASSDGSAALEMTQV